jgi:hypothetical protein|tara:strand:- start:4997 stop:5491 length:495 start_codon:yes stop_codon:yes gene_type:complete
MAQAKENIYYALNKVKSSIGKIEQRGDNPQFRRSDGTKTKYMKLEDILNEIEPLLIENNVVCFSCFDYQEMNGTLIPILIMEFRHLPSDTMIVSKAPCVDDTKRGSQQIGSGVTYMRRYMIQSILNLRPDPKTDDDGNSSSEPTSPEQEASQSTKVTHNTQDWI